jgi:C-terminal processing protease CtpA/Prc
MYFLNALFAFFLLIASVRATAQNCDSYLMGIREDLSVTKLCPESMLNDLQNLREALDKIHPDLYHYIDKEELDSAYHEAIKKVSNDLTAYEFSKTIAKFLSSIKDSHTNFNPQNLLFLGPKDKGTLPFFLIKIGDKFFIESMYENEYLKGKEVLAFNDLSAQDIFNESITFSLIEGSSRSAQEEIATKGMALVFSQMSRFKTSDSVKIKYVSGMDTITKKVKSTNRMNLYLYKGSLIEKSVSYFFDHENKGVLKILSFQPKAMGLFKKEVANFFKEVARRGCSEIVIDLRNNQGGYVKAHEYLMSFLNINKEQYVVQHVYKRSKFDPFSKMPYFKKNRFKRKAKREYPFGIHSKEYDFMISELGSTSKITFNSVPDNEYNLTYNGKCTLVVNGLSMSASVLFAGWFRNTGRGEIIGWPCLGSISGTFGTNVVIDLPTTGLPIMISTVKFNTYNSNVPLLEPISPDKLINYSIEDVLFSRDPVWDFLNIKNEKLHSLK